MQWTVGQMGSAVMQLIQSNAGKVSFRVQTVFHRSVHLISDKGEITALVSSDIGAGPLQWVIVDGADGAFSPKGMIKPGQRLLWNDRLCQLEHEGGEYHFDSLQSNVWTTKVFDHLTSSQAERAIRRIRAVPPKGMADTALILLGQQLTGAIRMNRPKLAEEIVKRLVGLGHGLTPAGDDMLFGFYSGLLVMIHHPNGVLLERWMNLFQKWLLEFLPQRTTPLSASLFRELIVQHQCAEKWAYWLDACAGDTIQALRDQALSDWLKTGHSSGKDTLYGLKLAIQQLGVYEETFKI